jgi:hypothetical protein
VRIGSCFAIVCLLSAGPALGEEARYLIRGKQQPVSVSSNGYAQIVRPVSDGSSEVRVATTLTPIGASGTYAEILAGETPALPAGFELPDRLLNELHPALDVWQAATLVLEWASDSIEVDVDDAGDQDAVSVLGRGRGRCSGLANATVALLRAAGFEARTISGLLVADDEAIPHRWIECHLPGAGWVASDPTLGLWTVTPRHLVFADTVVELPVVRVVSSSSDGLDRLPRHGGRLLRRNQGADLVCRLASNWRSHDSVAVLRGGGGEVRRARFDPEAHFSDLLPGVWILEVESAGSVVEKRRFDLREGDFRSYLVDADEDDASLGSDK